MKSIYLFLTLTISPFILWSQFNSSIEINGGLDYSFRVMNTEDSQASQASLDFYRGDLPKFNWHSGLAFNLKLKDKLHLKLGLQYT